MAARIASPIDAGRAGRRRQRAQVPGAFFHNTLNTRKYSKILFSDDSSTKVACVASPCARGALRAVYCHSASLLALAVLLPFSTPPGCKRKCDVSSLPFKGSAFLTARGCLAKAISHTPCSALRSSRLATEARITRTASSPTRVRRIAGICGGSIVPSTIPIASRTAAHHADASAGLVHVNTISSATRDKPLGCCRRQVP